MNREEHAQWMKNWEEKQRLGGISPRFWIDRLKVELDFLNGLKFQRGMLMSAPDSTCEVFDDKHVYTLRLELFKTPYGESGKIQASEETDTKEETEPPQLVQLETMA